MSQIRVPMQGINCVTTPPPGSVISYSAGTSDLSAWKFRVLKASDRIAEVIRRYPALTAVFSGVPPIIINGYPASLGVFPSGVFLDTYMRPINLARGLALAADLGAPVVFLAQPLVAASMLLRASSLVTDGPQSLILAVGGYFCPPSLESFLVDCGNRISKSTTIVHAYGVAEADYACLVGISRNSSGDVLYNLVTPDYRLDILNGDLRLRHNLSGSIIETGDLAEQGDGGVVIRNGEQRLHPLVKNDLADWRNSHWERRTGYLRATSTGMLYQLRENALHPSDGEVDYYEFCRAYGMSFADKPIWTNQDR